ncbi:hypothetical protein PIB30_051452 [Stylosanthes scabra]|uniref:Uncharacterized protein n=1 Tax=Stylosanthes scabra TaxID=79078 RepID=A0ABU6TIF8_9FABA|nr:hypothetical protein [Stylosanthes scabra]
MISSGEREFTRRRGVTRPPDEHWCITSTLQGTAGGGPARPLRRSSQKRGFRIQSSLNTNRSAISAQLVSPPLTTAFRSSLPRPSLHCVLSSRRLDPPFFFTVTSPDPYYFAHCSETSSASTSAALRLAVAFTETSAGA